MVIGSSFIATINHELSTMNKVFIITGQTATGKTKLALKLAQKNNGELINCDSRQIYKGLDIITGKDLPKKSKIKNQKSMDSTTLTIGLSEVERPKLQFKIQKKLNNFDIGFYELRTINYKLPTKIWLYDIIDPRHYFSSYDWVQCALYVIKDILSRGKTPIIVGGTYFYIKHLLYGFATERIAPNWQLRRELENKSIDELQKILTSLNPQIYLKLNNSDKNNPQRLIRKIEIARSSSSKFPYIPLYPSNQITLKKKLAIKNLCLQFIGLRFKTREQLNQKIQERVEKRFRKGAAAEVKRLIRQGYAEHDPGLKTIGYRQLFNYLNKRCTLEEATNEWITKEIQYAKRQYVFMKKDRNIEWKEIQ